MRPSDHLVLVGMMGAGKTTVGRVLAERLRRPFLDSDAMVEARTGRTVREIFEADGEPAYRPLETEALLEALASPEPAVVAAAGGVVLAEANRAALRAPGVHVVWLQADPSLLAERAAGVGVGGAAGAAGAGHRPLLDGDPEGNLRRLLEARLALYAEVADQVVDVEGRSVDEVVQEILA